MEEIRTPISSARNIEIAPSIISVASAYIAA
jgi:hypothetical protein